MKAIEISVDATEAYRKLLHVQVHLPVEEGTTAKFTTPLWLCDSHVPNGPVSSIAGLFFTANDKQLSWRRDPRKPYIYLVDVPTGVSTVHARFDAVAIPYATRRMLVVMWETVLLHQAYISVTAQLVRAAVTIPIGWSFATGLENEEVTDSMTSTAGTEVLFSDVTVERLLDSPVLSGQCMSQLSITPDDRHILCVAASNYSDMLVPPSTMAKMTRLIDESLKVFGEVPYRNFRFLLMLSDLLVEEIGGTGGGIEHSESCHIVASSLLLSDAKNLDQHGDLISHEFCHAWNGKYRRPAGHVPNNFITPLEGNLLWVYEGLTQYYGMVLAVRCGFMLPSTFRSKLAQTVAEMENTSGRQWRSIEDTATGVSLGKGLGKFQALYWRNWLRSSDYYPEGILLWLDVDTLLREKTDGQQSLDDFARAFFHKRYDDNGDNTMPYTIEQLEEQLNDIVAHDWALFFQAHVLDITPEVNVHGIGRAGYHLSFSDEPSELQTKKAGQMQAIEMSVGVSVDEHGKILDLRRFSAADRAKLAPTQTITHVGDEEFTIGRFLDQLGSCKEPGSVLSVRMQQDEDAWTQGIQYTGGLRYPKLQRHQGTQDVLTSILAPRCGV